MRVDVLRAALKRVSGNLFQDFSSIHGLVWLVSLFPSKEFQERKVEEWKEVRKVNYTINPKVKKSIGMCRTKLNLHLYENSVFLLVETTLRDSQKINPRTIMS